MSSFNPMVNLEADRTSRIFRGLSDPTRRKIIQVVANRDASAGELASPFSISKHLKVLQAADLVVRTREGETHRFQLNAEALQTAEETIKRLTGFWNRRLDHLDKYIKWEIGKTL